MIVNELQTRCVEFVKEYLERTGRKGHDDMPTIMMHMTEEVGELARQFYNEMAGRDELDRRNVGEELVDIFMDLCLLADKYGIDLEQAVTEKMEKDMKRLKAK